MKWSSYSERRSTMPVATVVALALSALAGQPATNGLGRVRLSPEPAHKGAEMMIRPANSDKQPVATGAIQDNQMAAQKGHRSAPPLVKPTPRYGFGDRGQSYDPVLGRPPGLILFSVSF